LRQAVQKLLPSGVRDALYSRAGYQLELAGSALSHHPESGHSRPPDSWNSRNPGR